jgi:hypothetical protein
MFNTLCHPRVGGDPPLIWYSTDVRIDSRLRGNDTVLLRLSEDDVCRLFK